MTDDTETRADKDVGMRRPAAASAKSREDRLAEALRANLRRRKAQQRGRREAPGGDPKSAEERGET